MRPDLIPEKLWATLPPAGRGALKRYLMDGIPPGGFMTSVLSDSFTEAVNRADDVNIHFLRAYALFMVNYLPVACWGSPAAVRAWIKDGGWNGRMAR